MTFLGGIPYPGYCLKGEFRAGVGPKLGGRWGGWPGSELAEDIYFCHRQRCYSPRFIVLGDGEEIEEKS